tara:strand:- start:1145 stop:1609 length:465 start_codon:yes stop_codon:yes gene_type:complete
MIFIAHRGNTRGTNTERENHPIYINEALAQDFDVEIDVWFKDNEFWLGHDVPQYRIDEAFLQNERLWCHAKDITTVQRLLTNKDIHCFFHQEDDVTLTSRKIMWTFPGCQLTDNSISVMPERVNQKYDDIMDALGICSDFIEDYYEVASKVGDK